MRVSFKHLGLIKTTYVYLNNVDWVRVTGEKVIVHCMDDRCVEVKHKKILDFEVLN